MASIRLENICKHYGDVVALDDVSIEVEDNAFFCLFGPPLSGKSTILKIILGLETPDSGSVFIDDRPMNGVSPAQRNVAMVFQNLALFPHMTALQNVRFPLVERKIAEDVIAARVDEVTKKLHMQHILHKPPSQLSGGERQRVAIARALVRDPVAYLMDDPISALDARLREETRVELRRIQREMNQTVIYVTHDQEEAMSVSDQMAIFEHGRVRQVGAPHDLYDAPASTYVAEMLGAPAINLMAAGGTALNAGRPVPQQAVQLGVRPEHLRVLKDGGNTQVSAIEPMGATTILTLKAGAETMKAALHGQPEFQVGESVSLSVDPAQIHFFDKNGDTLVAV
ncbi:MAG: ABC transporter ATP-binding protein [Rhizobiaceae bacterium]|nr:ABC transporter ATP-binding protein [Rhizobiaceae bacterium]|tara:strand:- start:55026 stop:56045 length:1020 start_codon:yes stop_codon:yes gene_type:complete